jgi:pimeloyl-ACP methyl ester carboxylesterase
MQSADGPQGKLDDREQTCLIDSGRDGLRLLLRGLRTTASSHRGVVLYLHGATFPSALSVAYRFDGVSWRDALCSAGFDVWALDFLGFGGSDRYLEMAADADAHSPLGLAADVVAQVEAAVQFILDWGDHQQVSLVTHSWGSMPAEAVRRQTLDAGRSHRHVRPARPSRGAALHATPDAAGVEARHQ